MTAPKTVLIAAGTLAGLGLAFALLRFAPGGAAEPDPGAAFLLPAPLPAPDFELTAHTGESVRLHELGEGRVLALFFGYTSCPDVCPLTMANLGLALDLVGADRERVRGVLVTVDPARDSAPRLAAYVGGFPGDILGLTGPPATLTAAAQAYLAYAERAPDPAGHDHGAAYLIDHTARVLVVRDRQIVLTFPPETSARAMADGLALALRR